MTIKEKIRELSRKHQGTMTDANYLQMLYALEEMAAWKDKHQELLEKSIEWFNDIAELCSKITSGNVSHLGATIRGKAIRASEFIEKHKNE